jgi:NAD+ diphosphatase
MGYAVNPLNRLSERREDLAYIDGLRAQASTRFHAIAGDQPVVKATGEAPSQHLDALFDAAEIATLGAVEDWLFLGIDAAGVARFAVGLARERLVDIGETAGLEVTDLRSLTMRGILAPEITGSLGEAKAMLDWHRRHRFCAACGTPTTVSSSGWRRDCANCASQHFPRVDPVVIMLATRGDRCLLGRNARFAPGMYSALAGFLEPGETIEDAVRREIMEEAGVPCSRVIYLASQPWPFPSSLMIGCLVEADSDVIVVDTVELEDARWFTRQEVRQMLAKEHPEGLSTPPPMAIAHHLVRAFVEAKPTD